MPRVGFLVSTIEEYREYYKISGKEAFILFKKYGIATYILKEGNWAMQHIGLDPEYIHDMIKRKQAEEKARHVAKKSRKKRNKHL